MYTNGNEEPKCEYTENHGHLSGQSQDAFCVYVFSFFPTQGGNLS